MYAIGTFARDDEQAFPGLVLGGEHVIDLSWFRAGTTPIRS